MRPFPGHAAAMPTLAKLEVLVKFSEMPAEISVIANQWRQIRVPCEGFVVQFSLRPKHWAKLEQAAKDWPLWTASVNGKPKDLGGGVLELEEPAVQVFERKPKEEKKPPVPPAA